MVDPDTTDKVFWGISARQLEPVLIHALRELRPADLLPLKPPKLGLATTKLRKDIADLERRRGNLLRAIEEGTTSVARRLLEIEQVLDANKRRLTQVEEQEKVPLCAAASLPGLTWNLTDNQARIKAAAAMRRIIARIDVGSERRELPIEGTTWRKFIAKDSATKYAKPSQGDEASWSFPDPVKRDKRRKPLWILVTFVNGAQRLIVWVPHRRDIVSSVRIQNDGRDLETNPNVATHL